VFGYKEEKLPSNKTKSMIAKGIFTDMKSLMMQKQAFFWLDKCDYNDDYLNTVDDFQNGEDPQLEWVYKK